MTTDRGPARALPPHPGSIEGRTILRFAHAYDSGGGTERYLDDLDHTLLGRQAATVIRLQLTRQSHPVETERQVGRGRIIQIGLPTVAVAAGAPGRDRPRPFPRIKHVIREFALYNPVVWRCAGARLTARHRLQPRGGEAIGAGDAAARILARHDVALAVFHFFGGADADEVLAQVRRSPIPVALVNHYSNRRFSSLPVRKHVMLADGVAGVNGREIPRYIADRLVNVSDGIDTEYFRLEKAAPVASGTADPVLLLPARVTREKGQLDLVHAAAELHRRGRRCTVVFAGRTDNEAYVREVRQEIARHGLEGSFRFAGNLTTDQLRDWYAASTLVAFPTYHDEGLGRVIVEAQAMRKPVVAYATGGVPDGIDSGRTGFLVPTGDVRGLVARIAELLASPDLREAIAARGRAAVEANFSLAALARRHTAFYVRVLDRAHQARRAA